MSRAGPTENNTLQLFTPTSDRRSAITFFDQHVWDGGIFGPYDYGSIMHYGAYDFAIDSSKPTIIAPQPIGQRDDPSAGDVQAIIAIHNLAGWALHICDGTQANAINFWVGSVDGNTIHSRNWFKWTVGNRREYPFPPDLLNYQKIYIKGEGDPHAQVNLCIVYNKDTKQGMTFHDDEDKTVGQDEHTNGCRCP